MMTVAQIKRDRMKAMKDKDTVKLSALRILLASLDGIRVEKSVEDVESLDYKDIVDAVNKNLKQLDQEMASLRDAERPTTSQEKQVRILKEYLPEQLSDSDVQEKVIATVRAIKEQGGGFGDVMKFLQGELNGRADMGTVSKVARKEWTNYNANPNGGV